MNPISFRKANENDVSSLRILARNSEAIWGFSESFLRIFDDEYNVTIDFVRNNIVFVMIEDNTIVGFWGLTRKIQDAELEYLYIDSAHIRKGLGKQLWNHMSDWCRSNDIRRIDFVTSHPAVKFYIKCGAVLNGTSYSSIDGRDIPKLYFEFK